MSDSKSWGASVEEEIGVIADLLKKTGFVLNKDQPHISGERFLMTKEKLVLLGERVSDQMRVVIKVSQHREGQEEIRREKKALDTLRLLSFASSAILLPRKVYFSEIGAYLVWVSEFIEQDDVFAARPVEEQFFMVLNTLETQEGFHANTFENLRSVSGIFPVVTVEAYLNSFSAFKESVAKQGAGIENVLETFTRAEKELRANAKLIERYGDYLTHTDFAPANTRLNGRRMYLIDLSSVLFGNKYEGWARFLNWALLHSPKLEKFLLEYVRKNRGEEEYLCLRLMRVYKVGFLVGYYAETLEKTTGDLHVLTQKRIELWHSVMEALLLDQVVPEPLLEAYRNERNSLRSKEEIDRQKEFNIPGV